MSDNSIGAFLDGLGLSAPESAPTAQPTQASSVDVGALADAVAARLGQSRQPEPASNQGAPMATSSGYSDPSDVTKWSEEDYQRQFQLKAPHPGRPYDIRNRSFYREIRLNAERNMINTRIQLGGKRKP